MVFPTASALLRAQGAALLLGFVLGCSTSPFTPGAADGGAAQRDAGADAGGAGGDGGLALGSVCQVLTERRCAYLMRCGLVGASAAAAADCRDYFTATWCGPSGWPAFAAEAIGTVRYDALRGEACAAAFTTRSCRDWDSEPESCLRMLSPGAELRERCYGSAGTLECTEGTCRGAACPRSCQPLGAAGDTCARSSDCRSPLFCRFGSTGAAVGQCSMVSTAGQLCMLDDDCALGLLCMLGACRAPPGEGAPCLAERCDESSYCAPSPDGGVCVGRADAGSPCAVDHQCQANLVCATARGQCVPAELSAAGASCTRPQRCPSGTICAAALDGGADGTCETERPSGASCTSSDECAPNLACVRADGGMVCGPRGGADGGCGADRDCQLLHRCVGWRCVPEPRIGQACSDQLPCRWGACADLDGGRLCVEPRAPGAPCQVNADCASATCVQGRCAGACTP